MYSIQSRLGNKVNVSLEYMHVDLCMYVYVHRGTVYLKAIMFGDRQTKSWLKSKRGRLFRIELDTHFHTHTHVCLRKYKTLN